MKVAIRILLLAIIVILGFTAVFPEWFDLKDAILAERHAEAAETERRAQDDQAKQRSALQRDALEAAKGDAEPLARLVWSEVESGNYEAPYEYGTERFYSTMTPAQIETLREIFDAMGTELGTEEAQTKPGYGQTYGTRTYPRSTQVLITESERWSENGLLRQTLELRLEEEELRVDGILLEVLAYPNEDDRLPVRIRKPHVFR